MPDGDRGYPLTPASGKVAGCSRCGIRLRAGHSLEIASPAAQGRRRRSSWRERGRKPKARCGPSTGPYSLSRRVAGEPPALHAGGCGTYNRSVFCTSYIRRTAKSGDSDATAVVTKRSKFSRNTAAAAARESDENAFSELSRRRPRVQVPSTPQVKYLKIIFEFGPCSKTCSSVVGERA